MAREEAIRAELDQLATCCNMLLTANRDEDSVERLVAHRIFDGIEFSVMRAAWLLDEQDEARRIHLLIGDHGEAGCPVCVGEEAFS